MESCFGIDTLLHQFDEGKNVQVDMYRDHLCCPFNPRNYGDCSPSS